MYVLFEIQLNVYYHLTVSIEISTISKLLIWKSCLTLSITFILCQQVKWGPFSEDNFRCKIMFMRKAYMDCKYSLLS